MGELFDDVARTLATTPSRRKAFRLTLGLLAGAAFVGLRPGTIQAASCAPPNVACGPTKQCLPTSGGSFVCCGYTAGKPGSGTACQAAQCNSAGVCCQGGQHPCNTSQGPVCCAANTQCQNGTCVPRGSSGAGGGQPGGGGQPPQSCPPTSKLCGSSGQCCPENPNPAQGGGGCCITDTTTGVMGCCWGGSCVNNVCVRGAPGGGPPTGGQSQQPARTGR